MRRPQCRHQSRRLHRSQIAPSQIPAGTTAASTGKPLVNLRNARTMTIEPSGSPEVVRALGSSTPTALAVGDFDADGAPDLVAGYRTADGGVVTLTRGNPDAFAPTDLSLYHKAAQGQMPSTFMPTATVYAVPESPDFIATGDFDRDGYRDVLVGANGGGLYLYKGRRARKPGRRDPRSAARAGDCAGWNECKG